MWKAVLIIYLMVAAGSFISMLLAFLNAWSKEAAEIERCGMEPPEGIGMGLAAGCVFFIISAGAAILWPLASVLLIGMLLYEKARKKWPDPGNGEPDAGGDLETEEGSEKWR